MDLVPCSWVAKSSSPTTKCSRAICRWAAEPCSRTEDRFVNSGASEKVEHRTMLDAIRSPLIPCNVRENVESSVEKFVDNAVLRLFFQVFKRVLTT